MNGKNKVSDEQLASALEATAGMAAAAARLLIEKKIVKTISKQTISKRISTNAMLKQVCLDAREETLDLAEFGLAEKVKEKDLQAIKFALETIGKHRGYSRRFEQTGADGGPIKSEQKVSLNAKDLSEQFRSMTAEQRNKVQELLESFVTGPVEVPADVEGK